MTQVIEKSQSFKMFNGIAGSYDFINGFISLGMHHRWRQRMLPLLPPRQDIQVLDLATGTGDVAITLARDDRVRRVIGIDLADNMIRLGRQKVKKEHLERTVCLMHGNAVTVPFASESFDVVTISFGIRNLPDVRHCLEQSLRVLKPGGKMIVLESALPANRVLRWGALLFIRFVLPWIGRLLSGDASAYGYLNETIRSFPSGDDFTRLMLDAGFSSVSYRPLGGGVVCLYQGCKGES